ncbi:MAG: hypothetical protein ACTHWA_01110 [Arachnia sp.]
MENHPVNDQSGAAQPLDQPDRGILHELGGRAGWRFWWPLVFWGVDALTLFLFRPDTIGEPPSVLLLTSLIAVVLIWAMGARGAIRNGHNKMLVRMHATLASLIISAGAAILTMVARVVEATVVGADQARVFITSPLDEEDPTIWLGTAEYSYLFYTLPVLVVLILIAWYLVGVGRARNQA